MSNNYRQFSFALNLSSKAEAVWFQKELTKLSEKEDKDTGGTCADYDWTVYGHEESQVRDALTGLPVPPGPPHVWFRDNGEYGNVDQIADVVQRYFKKFCTKGYFTLSWADTCSKHRIGEFGGGFCVVTAKGQHWSNEHEFVTKHTKGLESRDLHR
jgi:hypothetical protein